MTRRFFLISSGALILGIISGFSVGYDYWEKRIYGGHVYYISKDPPCKENQDRNECNKAQDYVSLSAENYNFIWKFNGLFNDQNYISIDKYNLTISTGSDEMNKSGNFFGLNSSEYDENKNMLGIILKDQNNNGNFSEAFYIKVTLTSDNKVQAIKKSILLN